MPLIPGTLLNNRYRIVSILGQGGMGAVYRAHDEHLNIPVAVKENLFLTQEYGRQFRSEAQILAGLRHANLPHVTDYFALENNVQYLVMDYVDGEDLRQRMERMGPLPEREAMLIGISICDALAYLHTREPGIVHRDIKPGNIKVTPEGQAVLVDFGLAKVMQGEQVTSTGARAMTPGYSPPEQYGTARTDSRSDIYSLGATLYAALTGLIPEDALGRVANKIRLTPVRELLPRVNRKLAEAIERALQVDPDNRFQDAEAFKKALIEAGELSVFYQERPTIPPPPEDLLEAMGEAGEVKFPSKPRSRPARHSRRRNKLWALIPGVFAVAAAGMFALTLFRPDLAAPVMSYFWATATQPSTSIVQDTQLPPDDTQAPAIGLVISDTPQPAAVVQGAETQLPEETPTLSPTPSPSPSPTLSPTPTETATPTIEVPPTPTATPRGGGAGQIAFASDRSGNMQIWLMSADGKQAPRPITNANGGACQPTWSPDGLKLAYTSPCLSKQDIYRGSNLYMIEVGQPNKPIRLTSGLEGDYDPAWSPDGQRIAFTSLEKGRSGIYLLDLDDLSVIKLSNTRYEDKQPAWSNSGLQIAFVRLEGNMARIRVMSDNGQSDTMYSVSGPVNNLWPAWTYDDQAIYFSQMSPDSAVPMLVFQRYEDRSSSREVRIPGDPKVNRGPFAGVRQSPDGEWFAYQSWPDLNHDIYIMHANGSSPLRLTTDRAYDFGPAWRPVTSGP